MKNKLDVRLEDLERVREILQQHLTPGAIVWAFGSRATGRARKYSDLDLIIDTGKPLSFEVLARLMSDFEESALPYKVDIVDRVTVSDSFLKRIECDRVMVLEIPS